MMIKHTLLIIIFFLSTGCYATITGTVIDAETEQPIEGAIVLVQWTVTKGLGLTYHEVYKIIEVETDKGGRFSLSGTYNPLADPPKVVIYKKNYVAWRNDFIFPGWQKRKDFKYKDGIIIKLTQFREDYSKEEYYLFLNYGIIGASFDKTPKYSAAESEKSKEAQREVEEKKKKN